MPSGQPEKPSQPPEWRALKEQCRTVFGFSPRNWTMREHAGVHEAMVRWQATGVVEYPSYYDMMRKALETGDPQRLRPFTLNGYPIWAD